MLFEATTTAIQVNRGMENGKLKNGKRTTERDAEKLRMRSAVQDPFSVFRFQLSSTV
jgi:hypothetical protein